MRVAVMIGGCWVIPTFISFLPIMQGWNSIGIDHVVSPQHAEALAVLLLRAGGAVAHGTVEEGPRGLYVRAKGERVQQHCCHGDKCSVSQERETKLKRSHF